MTVAGIYRIWEIGRHGSPPPALGQALLNSERLLWAAEVPVSRFVMRWVWLAIVAVPATLFFLYIAPWGQSMAEYCSGDDSGSCQKLYILAWPGVIALAHLSVYSLNNVWQAYSRPWLKYLGVSTDNVVIIDGNKPEKVHRHALDRDLAKVDWTGAVRFENAKTVIFVSLDLNDANRAVYWVNEGRHRPEFQNGPTP